MSEKAGRGQLFFIFLRILRVIKKKELTRSNCFHHLNYLLTRETKWRKSKCMPLSVRDLRSIILLFYRTEYFWDACQVESIPHLRTITATKVSLTPRYPPPPFVNSTLKICHLPAIVFYEALVWIKCCERERIDTACNEIWPQTFASAYSLKRAWERG